MQKPSSISISNIIVGTHIMTIVFLFGIADRLQVNTERLGAIKNGNKSI